VRRVPRSLSRGGLPLNDQLRSRLEELSAEYEKRLAQIRNLQQRAGEVTATARSRNGLISVQVDAQGQLLSVSLDPSAYDRLSPQRLASVLVELAKTAAADAAEQVRDIMAPVLPPGGVPAGGDVTGLMPRQPSTPGGDAAAQPQ
jgi:DNA-binding protein YbaB